MLKVTTKTLYSDRCKGLRAIIKTSNEATEPPMKKVKTRDKYFKFRLLLEEVQELKEMAKAENLDPSKFVRSRIFSKNIAA